MGRDAEIAALTGQISTIQQQLTEIHQLKKDISARTWSAAKPVEDIHGATINRETIKFRVSEIAAQIVSQFPDSNPVLVGIMDGGLPFLDLLRDALTTLKYPFRYTAMSATSYGAETTSGSLSIHYLGKYLPGGQTMILVDDVLDTGQTFLRIKQEYLTRGAKQVELVTLVEKLKPRDEEIHATCAFQVPGDQFLIGMGLDYLSELRNELEIRKVEDELTLAKPEEKEILDNEKTLNESLIALISTRDRLIRGLTHVPNLSIAFSDDDALLADVEAFTRPSPTGLSLASSLGQFLADVSSKTNTSPRKLSTKDSFDEFFAPVAANTDTSPTGSEEDFLVRQLSQPDDGSSSAMTSSTRM